MKTLSDITAEEVKELIEYDNETGIFRWKNDSGQGGRIKAGSVAGSINGEGYRYIKLKGKSYRACRLAWLVFYGEWPKEQIDHKDRDRTDDRINKLRDVTQSINKKNCGIYSNNTSGYPGVSFDKNRKKWVAHMSNGNGKKTRIGRFDSAKNAHEALVTLKGK